MNSKPLVEISSAIDADKRRHGALRFGVLAILVVIMAATRVNHFAPLPDASWALFFIAGFYLRGWTRSAFPLLMLEAVLVDYFVINGQGISFWDHYCVSLAYWFLVPAYLAMWLGGAWLSQHTFERQSRTPKLQDMGWLVAAFFASFAACYLISNGSFYWLSPSVPQPLSLGAWRVNLGDWVGPYFTSQSIYVLIAAAVHTLVVFAVKASPVAMSAKREF